MCRIHIGITWYERKLCQDMVVIILIGGRGVGGDGWKTEIFSYSELQQIGMLTILQRLTSALRQLRDGTRYGMTQSEGNQVQNHVNGTLHRMTWQNCKILCKDVWHFVYGYLKTYPWLMTINQMGKVTHSFSLPKQKQADSTSTFLNLRSSSSCNMLIYPLLCL